MARVVLVNFGGKQMNSTRLFAVASLLTVRKIEGVDTVVNNLEILPLSPNDDRIRREVLRTIYGDASIGDRYGVSAVRSIHIIVKNGDVRLEGVVANQFDRNLINARAKGVPGAFGVVDALEVESKK
jgi:hyperosmotically inducible protein